MPIEEKKLTASQREKVKDIDARQFAFFAKLGRLTAQYEVQKAQLVADASSCDLARAEVLDTAAAGLGISKAEWGFDAVEMKFKREKPPAQPEPSAAKHARVK